VKVLFSILFLLTGTVTYAQLTYETLVVDYDSAMVYKNLKIIPIRARNNGNGELFNSHNMISLSDAIKSGIATITERGTASTENVHWLRINNNSDSSIYVGSGEVIGGGRQDRMVMRDTILPPSRKDQYVSVMCVEEDRWSDKEKPFVYSGYANTHLRKMLDSAKNQVQIWREIDKQLERGHVNSKSLAYLSERELETNNKKKKVKDIFLGDDYLNFFLQKFKNTDTSIVGFVCVSGNKILGSDIFAGVNLFNQQLGPLLRGYIDEALLFGSPVTLPNERVEKYMDKILTDEKSQEEFVSKNGKIFRHQGKVIHINTF
jgi:ARG/rhodanese/phosphatase superfamily protein